jgi:hypothetical protein
MKHLVVVLAEPRRMVRIRYTVKLDVYLLIGLFLVRRLKNAVSLWYSSIRTQLGTGRQLGMATEEAMEARK